MKTNLHPDEIRFRVRLRAARARIFYALTLAEYIELWAGDEHATAVTCDSQPVQGGRFRMVCSNGSEKRVTINGRLEEFRPHNKIVFAWRHSVLGQDNQSIVTIDVLSRKAGAVVAITQRGVLNCVERAYFESLWIRCITWLSTFFSRENDQPLFIKGGRGSACDLPQEARYFEMNWEVKSQDATWSNLQDKRIL